MSTVDRKNFLQPIVDLLKDHIESGKVNVQDSDDRRYTVLVGHDDNGVYFEEYDDNLQGQVLRIDAEAAKNFSKLEFSGLSTDGKKEMVAVGSEAVKGIQAAIKKNKQEIAELRAKVGNNESQLSSTDLDTLKAKSARGASLEAQLKVAQAVGKNKTLITSAVAQGKPQTTCQQVMSFAKYAIPAVLTLGVGMLIQAYRT